MKRGFLNTARSKRAIEEVYAPPSPANQPGPKASPAQDAMDVDTVVAQEVYVIHDHIHGPGF